MSAIYDNWERLVAAVLKKEQLWQLCHAESVSPSVSSASSSFSFSHLSSSLDDVPFTFSSPQRSPSNQSNDDFGTKNSAPTHTSFFVKDQSPVEGISPNKNVNFIPPRKRDLKIQVPKLGNVDRGFIPPPQSSQHYLNVSPKMASASPTLRSKINRCNRKQESYPLPLPPAAISNSTHVSPPKPAVKWPSVPLPSPQTVKSPGTSWKKGKFIGRGPLGGVHIEKGQICAMKEVRLSSKDAKSKSEGTARPHPLDSGKVVSHSSKASKSSYQPSEIYTPRINSAVVCWEPFATPSIYVTTRRSLICVHTHPPLARPLTGTPTFCEGY